MTETRALIPNRIERVPAVMDVAQVQVVHTYDATYALDRQGRDWVRKRESLMGQDAMLGEAIGWLVGRALGVPLPDAAVCLALGEESWLSRRVPNVVAHWTASKVHLVENLDGVAAMLVLDLVLHHEDRHARNILLAVADEKGTRLRAYAIDHGNAHAAYARQFAGLRDETPDARRVAPGLPVDLLAAPAMQAAERGASLEPPLLRELVQEAFDVARISPDSGYLDALRYRLQVAPRLIAPYLKRVELGT